MRCTANQRHNTQRETVLFLLPSYVIRLFDIVYCGINIPGVIPLNYTIYGHPHEISPRTFLLVYAHNILRDIYNELYRLRQTFLSLTTLSPRRFYHSTLRESTIANLKKFI